MQFILLHTTEGKKYIYPVARIHLIMQFSDGETRIYDEKDDYHFCKETPEQIMALLEGKAETPAVPLIEGTFEWAMAHVRQCHKIIMPGWTYGIDMIEDLIHEAAQDRDLMESKIWELMP